MRSLENAPATENTETTEKNRAFQESQKNRLCFQDPLENLSISPILGGLCDLGGCSRVRNPR